MLNQDIQTIGVDLGRGYTKAYTEYKGSRSIKFKSIVGQGREMDFSNYDHPIYVDVDGDDYFCGLLAETEGDNPTRNSKDDKTSLTAKKLLHAVLSELAVSNKVRIMLGVPNKLFKKSILKEVQDTYKDKEVEIHNLITGSRKLVKIMDISIYREADAALIYTLDNHPEKNELENSVCGMVTVGFRTTELSYFDKGMKFNDKKSKTLEKGNITALDYVRKKIETTSGIIKEANEIDSSTDYDEYKNRGYINLLENIENDVEAAWVNPGEMKLFMAGGTSLKFNNVPSMFNKVDEPQMTTAKGLFHIGEKVFR